MFFNQLFDILSQSWFFTFYGIAASLLFSAICLVANLISKKENRLRRGLLVPFFLVYLSVVLFVSKMGIFEAGILFSALLYVPLGFSLAFIWPTCRTALKVLAMSVVVSAAASVTEFSLLHFLLNVGGSAIGYGFYALLHRWMAPGTKMGTRKRWRLGQALEPVVYIAMSFIGMQLLFDPNLLVPEASPIAVFLPDYVVDPTAVPIAFDEDFSTLVASEAIQLEEASATVQFISLEQTVVEEWPIELTDVKLTENGIAAEGLSIDASVSLTGTQIRDEIFVDQIVFRSYEQPLTIDTTDLYSTYALLVELERGRVLLDQNGSEVMYPASMTKVMTALVALEQLDDLNGLIYMDSALSTVIPWYAQQAGFAMGSYETALDLIYGVMLPSGAEATYALAMEVGGSVEGFVQLMNDKAAEIGMAHTHFTNPVGLHDDAHVTTLEDMVALLVYAWENEVFREVFTASHHVTASGLTMQSTLFGTLNRIEVAGGEILGGRTGFTLEAGRCLISIAYIDGRHYILATGNALNTPDNQWRHIQDAIYIFNQLNRE